MSQGFILCVSSLGVCIKTLLFFEEEAGGSDRGEAAHRVFYLRVFFWFGFAVLCLGLWLATLFYLYLLAGRLRVLSRMLV
jgi:hypothetical protein